MEGGLAIMDTISPIRSAGSASGQRFVYRPTPAARRDAEAALRESAATGSKALQLIFAAVAIAPSAGEHQLDVQA